MNAFQALLNSSLIHCLGWVLVHFIWQGTAVGVIYLGVRQLLSGKSPAVRYRLAMGTLAIMIALPIITFIHLRNTTTGIAARTTLQALAGVSISSVNQSATPPFSLIDHLNLWLQPLIPWTVPLWLLGVLAMTLRAWRGWSRAYQLRETATFLPLSEWHAVIESLCTSLGIKKLVRLAVSSRIVVPSVIGWLKPIILIPPSVMAGLTPLQMELILAHELAHIRRQDYLWNLLQVAVETLLFYHPVVRWISHHARLERELCCDDMVVRQHGNVVEYARALTELESLRQPRMALLLGANGGQVLDRVHRLLGPAASNTPAFWLPLLLAVGLLFATSIMHFTQPKTQVESVLTDNYTLLSERSLNIPASKTSVATLSPTRINVDTAQPDGLKSVQISNGPSLNALNPVSTLAAPVHTVAVATAPVNTIRLVTHEPPAASRAGGTVISRVPPTYPAFALERETQGSATVQFTLTPSGDVTGISVVKVAGSRLFGIAAADAIRQWRFKPVTVAGVPVTQRMTQEFIFRLNDQDPNNEACKIPMGYHVCIPN